MLNFYLEIGIKIGDIHPNFVYGGKIIVKYILSCAKRRQRRMFIHLKKKKMGRKTIRYSVCMLSKIKRSNNEMECN